MIGGNAMLLMAICVPNVAATKSPHRERHTRTLYPAHTHGLEQRTLGHTGVNLAKHVAAANSGQLVNQNQFVERVEIGGLCASKLALVDDTLVT